LGTGYRTRPGSLWPSGWPGHQPGPGRYILGLARRVELELFFVFLFRVLGHGGIIKPTADLVVKAGKEDRPRRRWTAPGTAPKREYRAV